MISVRSLVKDFGSRRAVDCVSFEVNKGEVLGFLGPNGAGKTTTMRMITGFLKPDQGTVLVDGFDVLVDPVAVKSRVGYLPEGSPSYPDMTVEDFLLFVAEIRGLDGAARSGAVEKAIQTCFLTQVTRQIIGTLSKGYRQRVGFAQAIIHDPPVLILDEPTDGLDPNQKHEVRNLISRLAAEKVIVLSTHILEEVEAVCTRAIIMTNGEIVADDTPRTLVGKSSRHGLVTLQCQSTDASHLVKRIQSIEEVEQVEIHQSGKGDVQILTIYPIKNATDVARKLGELLKSEKVLVEELSTERGRFDEVFRQITKSTE